MTDNIISFNGSPIGPESEDKPELTDITPPPGGIWQAALTVALNDKAQWGALLYVTDEGQVRAVWINSDRPAFRGLIEEARDELRLQLREAAEEC